MFRSAVLAVACLALAGCSMSPEAMMVGAWTPDSNNSELPKVPIPGVEKQIRAGLATTILKLRADKTFLLGAGRENVEGKWGLDGDFLTLKANAAPTGPLAVFGKEIRGVVEADRKAIYFEKETPLGKVNIVVRKSG